MKMLDRIKRLGDRHERVVMWLRVLLIMVRLYFEKSKSRVWWKLGSGKGC